MSDDDEVHQHVKYGSHCDTDDAFCAAIPIAIAAELENAPTGVITTPGTKKPIYVRAEPPWPLTSSLLADMDF
jgi:hypothetical protein